MDSLNHRIERLVKSTCEHEGFELVDMTIRGKSSSRFLQVFVDRSQGITSNECAFLSRQLLDKLNMTLDPTESDAIRLEVSSPGIDRPLHSRRDFERNIGRHISATYVSDDENISVEGKIIRVDGNTICLQTGMKEKCIELEAFVQAKIVIQWE